MSVIEKHLDPAERQSLAAIMLRSQRALALLRARLNGQGVDVVVRAEGGLNEAGRVAIEAGDMRLVFEGDAEICAVIFELVRAASDAEIIERKLKISPFESLAEAAGQSPVS